MLARERRLSSAVFDVLHLFVLEGPRIPREHVIAYVHRATSLRRTSVRSKARAYERMKARLRSLGVRLHNETDPDGNWFLVVPRAARDKARLERVFRAG